MPDTTVETTFHKNVLHFSALPLGTVQQLFGLMKVGHQTQPTKFVILFRPLMKN